MEVRRSRLTGTTDNGRGTSHEGPAQQRPVGTAPSCRTRRHPGDRPGSCRRADGPPYVACEPWRWVLSRGFGCGLRPRGALVGLARCGRFACAAAGSALRSYAASEAEFRAGRWRSAGRGSSPAAACGTPRPPCGGPGLGGDGALLATTPALAGRQSLVADRPAPDIESLVEVGGSATDIEDTLVVAARGVATPAGNRVVLVGESLRQAARSAETTRNLLLLGVPVLALVAGCRPTSRGVGVASGGAMRTLVADLTDRTCPSGSGTARLDEWAGSRSR